MRMNNQNSLEGMPLNFCNIKKIIQNKANSLSRLTYSTFRWSHICNVFCLIYFHKTNLQQIMKKKMISLWQWVTF